MGLAFALLFQSGAIVIRLFSFKGLVWVHAGAQMLAYALAIAGLGLGIYISVWPSQVDYVGLCISFAMLSELTSDRLAHTIRSSAFWSCYYLLSNLFLAWYITSYIRSIMFGRSGQLLTSGLGMFSRLVLICDYVVQMLTVISPTAESLLH